MTDKINDGGPAFPSDCHLAEDKQGLSVRDWFAGMALQGIISCGPRAERSFDELAYGAYLYADSMIKVREKAQGE